MPERYGTSDRYVYTLEYADGTQVIILGGKFAPHVVLRVIPPLTLWLTTGRVQHFIYKYNGKNLTTERLPNGKVNRLTGKWGNRKDYCLCYENGQAIPFIPNSLPRISRKFLTFPVVLFLDHISC